MLLGISCSKDIPALDRNNIFDDQVEAPAFYHIENLTYTPNGGNRYSVLITVVVYWELLEKYTNLEKSKIHIDGLGYAWFYRDNDNMVLYREVLAESTYCTSISFLNGDVESSVFEGECFTVPD